MAKEVTALTVVPAPQADDGRTTALAPFNVERQLPALLQLAKVLVGARGMVPSHLKSEGEIVAALLAGAELGIPPMASLRNIHLIQGRVGLDASLQLGLLLRAGIRSQWLESTAERASLKLTRAGFEPHTQTYVIADAKAAGLTGKDNWKAHPAAMLRARCVSAAVKAYAADVVSGVYTPEELEDIPTRGSRISDPVADQVVHDGHIEPERMEEAKARDAKHKAESKLVVDEWLVQLKSIAEMAKEDAPMARRNFHSWVSLNGYAFRKTLQRSQGSRAWGFIFRCFERLSEAGAFDGENAYTADQLKTDLADAEPTASERAEAPGQRVPDGTEPGDYLDYGSDGRVK